MPSKKTCGIAPAEDQACVHATHNATRALTERDNALLKDPFAALRHVTTSPSRVGTPTAALVVLHLEHHRTV